MTQSGQTLNEGPTDHQGPPPQPPSPPAPPPAPPAPPPPLLPTPRPQPKPPPRRRRPPLRRCPPPPHLQPRPYRKIQRVPKLLLKAEKNREDYNPKAVSIGPYHHGKRELRSVESFKPTALRLFFLGIKEKKEDYYHEEIKKRISNIRNCYEQDYIKSYSDDELVRMMLLDACFIIIYMETSCMEGRPQSDHEKMIARNAGDMVQKLGISIMSNVLRDMFLLENQIPLWIIKLLLKSRYDGNQLGEELLHRYMTRCLFEGFRGKRYSPLRHSEDFHLLEAFHSLVVDGFVPETKKTCLSFISRKFFCCSEAREKTFGDPNIDIESGLSSQSKSRFGSCMNYVSAGAWRKLFKNVRGEGDYARGDLLGFKNSFCSVTDLKAAGIRFKPNQTLSLKDVTFESNCIFGKLQLPFWCVSTHTKVFFMNMIAYEGSPDTPRFNAGIVIAYINLMKLLIVRPEDVKELREKKILCSKLENDEKILQTYQDINTFGVDKSSIFDQVSQKIQAHCNGKAKRWIPELVNTHFRSPWSVIALLAAAYLLVLTTLQTIYTMKL